MPAANLPDRIVWAVETLNIKPSDHLLEIGCGRGIAASLICERLGRGRLTAIDRSKTMIAAARKQNRAHLDSGKVRFEVVALADAELGRQAFSKILAINVNLFWMDPSKELAVIRKLLRPNGALYLVYEPPARASQLAKLASSLIPNLERGGLMIRRLMMGQGESTGILGVIAGVAARRS
jgi:SAM-dependent methyltransferase